MASIEVARAFFLYDRFQKGWDEDSAAYVCFAIHPLDDVGSRIEGPDGTVLSAGVPARRFEKAVRKRSRALARTIRAASAASAVSLAEAAWADYRRYASEFGETYYIARFAQFEKPKSV